VYASKKANPSLLSLFDLEGLYKVLYVPCEVLIVHLSTYDLAFKWTEKLYVADSRQILTPYKVAYATVMDNESIYTWSEIKRAKEAYELLKCSRYPSPDEAIHLLQDGNIFSLPDLTREDLIRAYDIYGTPVAYVWWKLTKKAISHMVIDPSAIIKERVQTLHTDVMQHKFLVSLVEPLQLTLQTSLMSETANQLGLGLQGQLSLFRTKGFQPIIVYIDP
jgi:hypothetical protein